MKLFLICGIDSNGQGGAPRSTLDLAIALKERGHAITLVGNYSQASEELACISKYDIEYLEFSMNGVLRFPLSLLRRRIISAHPDMVISTHRGCDIMTSLALAGTGVLRGSIIRMLPQSGTENQFASDGLRNLLWYQALRSMNLLIGISDDVAEQIVSIMGVRQSRVVRIYNAVDTDYFRPSSQIERFNVRATWDIPADIPVVLIAGRIEPVKRPLDVIPVAEILRDVPLIFAFAGDGSLQKDVRNALREHDLEHKVLFLGKQSDMTSAYIGCDILLHFGQNEAFGRIVVESYACGKPVVCVNRGGIRELVQHGKTGFLFEAGDYAGAARYIRNLIKDQTLYRNVSCDLRKRAEEYFSLPVLGNNFEIAITRVLRSE